MAKKTKSKNKKPMSKGGKIAIISISAALVIGGTAAAIVFSTQIKEFVDKWFYGAKFSSVNSEYKAEKGIINKDGEIEKPFEYLGSAESKVESKEGGPEVISAHTFLIGRVSSVPFYKSGWVKFDYENIGMTISYSQISTTSVSKSLSETNETTKSSTWEHSDHFQEKLVASVEGGIGPVKAKAENTIDYQVDNKRTESNLQRYVSSSEQTNTSIETLQKTADYSVQLNSRNGFKKGKYYRMTLQQTASMYMIVYENNPMETKVTLKTSANANEEEIKPGDKFYQLTSFLDDPSNYQMVIEESDVPDVEADKDKIAKFDDSLYDECAAWVEKARDKKEGYEFDWIIDQEGKTPSHDIRLGLLKNDGFDGRSVTGFYRRNTEWRITDATRHKNPSDKVTFPTLFKDKNCPTFGELFNEDKEEYGEYRGLGYKNVKVEMEFEYREYNDGYQHFYLVDKNNDVIDETETDISSKWRKKNITWKTIDAYSSLATSIDPAKADGKIHIMYEAFGKHADDWGIRNLLLKVTVSK